MNFKSAQTALLFLALLAVAASCKKEDIPEEYKRGGNAVTLNADGNLLVAGYNSSTSKSYEAALMLVDKTTGDSIWSQTFGGTYSDAFYSVKPSKTGGYIAAGFSNRVSAGSPQMMVVMTDANGGNSTTLKYGGTAYSQGFCVIPDADSGYLVSGYIQTSSTSDRNIYLVRINDDGDVIWTKSIGATSTNIYDTVNDAAYNVIAAADSGYYVTGSLNGYSSCCGQIFLMKVSPSGDSLWTKTFGTGVGYSLTLTSDGGVAIAGTLQESTNQDVILIKTDASGNKLWSYTYGGANYEYGANMVQTTDNGFAITGITTSQGYGYDDVYLVKTNSSGVLQWDETYGGGNNDQGFGLTQNAAGEFFITGLSNTNGSFIFINKTSSEGGQQWVKYLK